MGTVADRLAQVLDAALKLPPATRAADAWRIVLLVEEGDDAGLLRAIAAVDDSIAEVERLTRLGGDIGETALRRFDEVQAIRPRLGSLDRSIGWVLEPLDDTGMESLDFCASVVSALVRGMPGLAPLDAAEGDLDAATTEELLRRTREVRAGLSGLDVLGSWEKRRFLEYLGELEQALLRASVAGHEPTLRAIEGILGMLSNPDLRRRLQSVKSNLLAGLLSLIVAVDLALNLGANFLEISRSSQSEDAEISLEVVQIIGVEGTVTPGRGDDPKGLPSQEKQDRDPPVGEPE